VECQPQGAAIASVYHTPRLRTCAGVISAGAGTAGNHISPGGSWTAIARAKMPPTASGPSAKGDRRAHASATWPTWILSPTPPSFGSAPGLNCLAGSTLVSACRAQSSTAAASSGVIAITGGCHPGGRTFARALRPVSANEPFLKLVCRRSNISVGATSGPSNRLTPQKSPYYGPKAYSDARASSPILSVKRARWFDLHFPRERCSAHLFCRFFGTCRLTVKRLMLKFWHAKEVR
jgi:hypothetical protein